MSTARGDRPRDRAGAHRVPADLEHRPPAHRPRVPRLGGSRAPRSRPSPSSGRWPRSSSTSARTSRGSRARGSRSLRDRRERRELDARLGWYIVLGTVPIGIFGVLFKDQIETGARDLYLIGTALIVLGLRPARWPRRSARASARSSRSRRADGFSVGLAQALALIPGVSRSGATITAGLFLGLRPRGRGALLVPAVGPGRGAQRPVRARLDHERRGGPARRGRASSSSPRRSRSSSATRRSRSCCASSTNHSTFVFVAYRVVLGVARARPRQRRRDRVSGRNLSRHERSQFAWKLEFLAILALALVVAARAAATRSTWSSRSSRSASSPRSRCSGTGSTARTASRSSRSSSTAAAVLYARSAARS